WASWPWSSSTASGPGQSCGPHECAIRLGPAIERPASKVNEHVGRVEVGADGPDFTTVGQRGSQFNEESGVVRLAGEFDDEQVAPSNVIKIPDADGGAPLRVVGGGATLPYPGRHDLVSLGTECSRQHFHQRLG